MKTRWHGYNNKTISLIFNEAVFITSKELNCIVNLKGKPFYGSIHLVKNLL
ncbi:hypothetical protein FORC93_3121 [Salmonella enterica subsp. enterica serovar Braenderup]|nr:hypothetical protein FORC93_3121 [Salmonella enterica subsp. enterica serovar Braenderup]